MNFNGNNLNIFSVERNKKNGEFLILKKKTERNVL